MGQQSSETEDIYLMFLCQLSSPTSYFCSMNPLRNILLELGSKHVCWNEDGGTWQFKQMVRNTRASHYAQTTAPVLFQSNHVGGLFSLFPPHGLKNDFFLFSVFKEMVELSIKQIMSVGFPLQQWQLCFRSLKKGSPEVPYSPKRLESLNLGLSLNKTSVSFN